MELFTNQVLAGIATGAIYACMALAVVMIYQAIDHLNFAQGEMAMFSTFISWQLMQWGVPYWGAFLLTLAFSFAGGILIERLLFKPLAKAPILTNVAGFIALYAIINSVAGLVWDFTIKQYPTPFGSSPFLGSQLISTHQAGMIGVTVLLLVALYFFFQFTRMGLAMRAAASVPESARLVGINTSWMIALGWGMAAAIGSIAGMLIAPVVFLEPNMMGGVLIYGFAAAVLGGLTSPFGAVIGGFLVGIFENLAGTYIPGVGNELKLPIALALIITVLVVKPAGLFGRPIVQEIVTEAPAVAAVPKKAMTLGTGTSLVMLALLIAAPLFVKNFIIFQLTMLLIYGLAVLALNILTGGSGQFSLGQSAFYAVGAYTSAILMEHVGMNYALTLPIAGVICFAFGFLFGQPALRLSGVYLALATFALATAMPQLLKLGYFEHWTGGVQGLVVTKPDAPFGLPISQDMWLYYFTLAITIAIYIFSVNLLTSRSGRAFMAIRDNEIAASAMGIDVALYKTLAFGVSAGITGVAGGLGAIAVQFVAPDGYTITLAISLFLGMVVGGVGWLPGSIVGSAFIIFVPNIAEGISKGLSGAVFGVLLFLVIFLVPHGARQVAMVAQHLLGKLKKN
jgi:branched-chain amino acid transport system permease protein